MTKLGERLEDVYLLASLHDRVTGARLAVQVVSGRLRRLTPTGDPVTSSTGTTPPGTYRVADGSHVAFATALDT